MDNTSLTAGPTPNLASVEAAYARGDFAAVRRLAQLVGTPEALALKDKVSLDLNQVGVGLLAIGVSLLVAVWTLSTQAH